jgi:hypothetical protein
MFQKRRNGHETTFLKKAILNPLRQLRNLLLTVALVTLPAFCLSQGLPESAQPRPGAPVKQPQAAPEDLPEIEVLPMGEAAPPGASKVLTKLRGIEFQGISSYSDVDLKEYYQE